MSNIAEIYSSDVTHKYFGPATVLENIDDQGFIEVKLIKDHQGNDQVFARIALQLIRPLKQGDEVLIAGQDLDNLYVIGVLPGVTAHRKSSQRHTIGHGAYVLIDESNSTDKLQVFNKRNELIVEYEPESEKTRINVEKGNLEFSNHDGDIIFDTKNNIRLNGHSIKMESHSNIQLSVADALGRLISSLSIRPKRLKLNSAQLDMTAKKSEIHIEETHYLSKKLRAKVEDSQLIAGKLTTIAKSITEKAKNTYKTVEELSQLKAGRMRTLVSSTFHLKAKLTYMKSEEDIKINAEKIHLG